MWEPRKRRRKKRKRRRRRGIRNSGVGEIEKPDRK